jgi:hypothetical protein
MTLGDERAPDPSRFDALRTIAPGQGLNRTLPVGQMPIGDTRVNPDKATN